MTRRWNMEETFSSDKGVILGNFAASLNTGIENKRFRVLCKNQQMVILFLYYFLQSILTLRRFNHETEITDT